MARQTVTTKRAAEIVGVGYEGFRSYLKRGLLGRVGMLPGFYAPGAQVRDEPAPRSRWKRLGATDLCLMRIAKMLMDEGFSFAKANSVVSRHRLWDALAHDEEPVDRFLLVWPPYGDHIIFEPHEAHLLPRRMMEAGVHGVVTLISLAEVQRHVFQALEAA